MSTTWLSGLLVAASASGLSWLLTRLQTAVALRRLRKAVAASWIERARLAYPARRAARLNLAFVPPMIGAVVAVRVAPALGLAPTPWAVASALASLVGFLAAGHGLERRLLRGASAAPPRGVSLGALFLLPVVATCGLVLALIPTRWGWGAAAALALGAALTAFHCAGGWFFLLRKVGRARPASPRLESIVGRASARVGVRPRATYELDSPNANAMAWPLPRLLVYTTPILALMDDAELAAVTAHELGHLDEPWPVYLTRLTTPFLFVGVLAGVPIAGSFGLLAGLAPVAALFVGIVVAGRVGRRMEERSDRVARRHEGDDAGTYARALERLYEANLLPVVTSRRVIHPHLYDRLTAAGVTPAYPRPDPPPKSLAGAAPVLFLLAFYVWVMIEITGTEAGAGAGAGRDPAASRAEVHRAVADDR